MNNIGETFKLYFPYYYKGSTCCELRLENNNAHVRVATEWGDVIGDCLTPVELAKLILDLANEKSFMQKE